MREAKGIRTKILIPFIAGIGDVILFTPVLKGFLRHYKDCKISIIVPPDLAPCIKKMPYFADVVVCETSNEYSLLKRILQLTRLCVYVLRRNFDIVITPLSVECTTASLLSRVSRAKTKIGYTRTSNNDSRSFTESINVMPFEHDLFQNLKVLSRLSINPSDKKMEFFISESDKRDADAFLKESGVSDGDTLVAFHPVTLNRKGYNKRDWPAERFAQLGSRIYQKYGAKVIIMGSSEDRKIAEDIKAHIGKDAIIQTGKTSIHVAAAILERCNLMVCNDSSLMHIGAAMGVPIVSIWGPTNHKRRGYSDDNQIIIRKQLSCSPCQREGRIAMPYCETRECLMQISVEEVFDSCREILSGKVEK